MASKRQKIHIKNFNIVRRDRLTPKQNNNNKDHGGGVCILIKANLTFDIIDSIYHKPCDLETIAISLHLGNNEEILICSIYRVPDNTTPIEKWNKLFQSINQHNTKYKVVGGDLNAHNTLWGSSHNCPTGLNLADSLENTNLVITNDGSMTYCKQTKNTAPVFSAIDLTLISSNLFLQTTWKTKDEKMFSDHYQIEIEINKNIQSNPHIFNP